LPPFYGNALQAETTFPFPVNDRYSYGIIAANANATTIQQKYLAWKEDFYEEQGELARIKWDTPEQTVSEGIAYGMLVMVYMDNATNQTQDEFDKLWAYYKKYMNGNGVMDWKINGFSSVAENGGATDAELDAAVALLMAYKQWGDEKYKSDAETLIQTIWDHEVSDTYFLKPGDTWNDRKNPSYFSTAAFELFREVNGNEWDKVIDKAYELLDKSANETSGLVPDWCDEEGGDLGTHFSWDAVRTPWRIAWAHAWYGHEEAKKRAQAMTDWILEKTGSDPEKIVQGYALNGDEQPSDFPYKVGFTGAFTCAGMVDSTYQQWVNDGYQLTESQEAADNYYQRTLVVMYLLLLSGNMQNLWEYTGNTPVTYSGKPEHDGVRKSIVDITDHGVAFLISLHAKQPVSVKLTDLRGRCVTTLYKRLLGPGEYRYMIPKASLSSGIYLVSVAYDGTTTHTSFVHQ
jgi:endo-1,4-beta-D-glucanase Y